MFYSMKRFRLTGLLIFAGVFVLVIGLQELGWIPNISMPSASSWIFLALNLVVPAGVMILSWWLLKVEIGIGTSVIFIAYTIFVLFQLGVLSGNWAGIYGFPLLLTVGCGILLYASRKVLMQDYGLWLYGGFLGVIVFALIAPSIFTTSKYAIVALVPGLISIPVAFMLVSKKGGLLAVSALMIALSFTLRIAPDWIRWLSEFIEVGGFIVLGIFLAGSYWANRRELPEDKKSEG